MLAFLRVIIQPLEISVGAFQLKRMPEPEHILLIPSRAGVLLLEPFGFWGMAVQLQEDFLLRPASVLFLLGRELDLMKVPDPLLHVLPIL